MDEDDPRFEALFDQCIVLISHLKALNSAWETFCAGVGISASDVNKMIGMPSIGTLGHVDLVQGIVGDAPMDEEFHRECLDRMRTFWTVRLEDRYGAVG